MTTTTKPGVCGVVVTVLAQDGQDRLQRVDCDSRKCPRCGPRYRARKLAHYGPLLAEQAVYRLVVANADWRALRVRLKRAGGDAVRIPAPNGQLVVLNTHFGLMVDDPQAALTAALDTQPLDDRHLSATAAWQERAHRQPTRAQLVFITPALARRWFRRRRTCDPGASRDPRPAAGVTSQKSRPPGPDSEEGR